LCFDDIPCASGVPHVFCDHLARSGGATRPSWWRAKTTCVRDSSRLIVANERAAKFDWSGNARIHFRRRTDGVPRGFSNFFDGLDGLLPHIREMSNTSV